MRIIELESRWILMSKREIILENAIQLFSEQGIEHTTVSDIVKAGNMAQGTFYNYFPSKMSLMPAIAEEMVKLMMIEIKDRVDNKQSTKEKFTHIVDSIFFINKEHQEILAMVYAGLSQTEHLKEWEAVYRPCYEWLSRLIDDGKSSEEIASTVSSEQLAKLIIGLIESAAEQVFLFNYASEDEVTVQKEAVLTFLFAAIQLNEK